LHWDRVRETLDAVAREHDRQGEERSTAAREADRVAHELHEQIVAERRDHA
jgi:hypothetical protein